MNNLKIRAIIIDDEQEGRDVIRNLLNKISEVQLLDTADGADAGLQAILKHQPDLIFLDI